MNYIVCKECRYIYERPYDCCPTCGTERRLPDMEFPQKIEAEAYAAGLWLADGYHVSDFKDPYFKPRR